MNTAQLDSVGLWTKLFSAKKTSEFNVQSKGYSL